MTQRTIFLIPLSMIAAGIAAYIFSKTGNLANTESSEKPLITASSSRGSLSDNKPLSRKSPYRAPSSFIDNTPLYGIKNERVLRFENDRAYKLFLASLSDRNLRLLGRSDRLRALRIGFDSASNLDGIDENRLGFNFQATIPILRQGEVQAGAVGFGANSLSWLGINTDNSAWGEGVTVAVIDSGVNSEHIAFTDAITNIELTALPDGTTQLSHGTAVASIISGDHPLTPGVAPAAEILSFRVTNENGISDSFTLADAIVQAADAGADVINISLGTFGNSPLVEDAVIYAQEQGSVIVASSGNEGIDTIAFPAAYEGVISVGAIEAAGDRLDFSNTGSGLSITAPGLEVNAAWGEEQLTAFTGTSASAPFVSGAVAAVMSENPSFSSQQAADLVLSLANDAGLPGNDAEFGLGQLDVGRVMQNGTSGIIDAAVTAQVLVPAENSTSLPTVLVTIQNQGTETLINSPVTIDSPSGTREINISSLSPGQTQTFPITLIIPANGNEVTVSSSVSTSTTDQDSSNNSRITNFSSAE